MHGVDAPFGGIGHFLVAEQQTLEVALQTGNNRILPDIQNSEDTVGPSLFRQQGKAVFNGLGGVAVQYLLAAQEDFAALAGGNAEDVLQQFRPSGGVQTGDAQNLALSGGEGHIPQVGIHTRQALYPEQLLAHHIVLVRIPVGKFPADHQTDNLIHGQLLGGLGGDPLTVTHDGDVVGNPQNFLHLMGDVDNAAAPASKHIDDLEQMLNLVLRQRGGGLVKDNNFRVIRNCFCNFYHLALGNGHGAHDGLGIDLNAQLVKHRHGGVVHFLLTGEGQALCHHGEAAQPHVVHNIALEGLVQLLVHHGNAIFQGFLGVLEIDFLTVEEDLACVLLIDAEQAFHQCRLTRAVFTHQGVNRTGPDREIDTIQRLDTGELFYNSFHAQQDRFLILFQILRLLLWNTHFFFAG